MLKKPSNHECPRLELLKYTKTTTPHHKNFTKKKLILQLI